MPIVKKAKKSAVKPSKNGKSKKPVVEVQVFEKEKMTLSPNFKEALHKRLGYSPEQAAMLLSTLAPSQLRVALLIGDGYSSEQIGAYFGISKKTVDVHRQAIFGKMDIHRTAELIKIVQVDKFNPPMIVSKETTKETADA